MKKKNRGKAEKMIKGEYHNIYPILILLLIYLLIFLCANAVAEEKLIIRNDDGEEITYIGWQTAKDKFTTCDHNKLNIDHGKVTKTKRVCTDDNYIQPLAALPSKASDYTIIGTIKKINPDKSTFQIMDNKGHLATFYYSEINKNVGKIIQFQNLKINEKVIVTTPIEERAISVQELKAVSFHGGRAAP